jgi:hypothetical protein
MTDWGGAFATVARSQSLLLAFAGIFKDVMEHPDPLRLFVLHRLL